MAHAEGTTTINRPATEVFAFLLDGTNNPLWRPAVIDIQRRPDTPLGVGAIFKQGVKGPGGRRLDADYEIVECDPNEALIFHVIAGPARPTGTFNLRALGDATEVTFTLLYEPKGLAKLMDPLITRTMQSEVATLANLKAYLERQPANE
jgi:uncharacterized membrane protein